MTRSKFLCIAFLLTLAVVAVPGASAGTCSGTLGSGDLNCVHFIGAGSSAMWQGTLVAVYNDIVYPVAHGSGGLIAAHHWTMKSTTDSACTPLCASIQDPRVHPVQTDSGNVWVAWLSDAATGNTIYDVWAYYSVDSAQGDRAFLSRSGAHTSAVVGLIAGDNQAGAKAVSSLLFDDQSNDLTVGLTTAGNLATLVSNAQITAAFTDIRAEDALYANERACSPLNTTNWTGLGYSTSKTCGASFAGIPVESAYTQTSATPIAFQVPGFADPIETAYTVPTSIVTISVGEAPMVFITNRENLSGLGNGFAVATTSVGTTTWGVGTTGLYSNVNDGYVAAGNPFGTMYSGINCSGGNPAWTPGGGGSFPITVIMRELLSGTYNTTEWTEMRQYGSATGTSLTTTVPTTSQEANIGQPVLNTDTDPVYLPCTVAGQRARVVGSSEMVTQVKCGNGIDSTGCTNDGPTQSYADAVGYAFFSFSNVSSISLSPKYGYVTVDGVDPIFPTYNWTSTTSPSTAPGQPIGGTAFGANNGTYWPGTLPACTVGGSATQPACTAAAVWGSASSTFPNLRNGTYRAWSMLRALCDPLELEGGRDQCLPGSGNDSNGNPIDPGSLGNAVAAAQSDINNNASVPDFLPAASISLVRAHFAYKGGLTAAPFDAPPSHQTPAVKFYDLATGVKNVPADYILGGGPDYGGDAGGCIEDATTGGITLTSAINTKKFDFTQVAAASPLSAGDVITVTGCPGTGTGSCTNGTYQVTKIITPGAELKLTPAMTDTAGTLVGVTASVTQCAQ